MSVCGCVAYGCVNMYVCVGLWMCECVCHVPHHPLTPGHTSRSPVKVRVKVRVEVMVRLLQ